MTVGELPIGTVFVLPSTPDKEFTVSEHAPGRLPNASLTFATSWNARMNHEETHGFASHVIVLQKET